MKVPGLKCAKSISSQRNLREQSEPGNSNIVSVKAIISNPNAGRAVRIVLILLGVTLIAGIGFFEGMFYANRRATIRIANDGCFYSLNALTILKEPEKSRLAVILDWEMDYSGAKLAEMSLRYPSLIERGQYNLLVQVRDYRKKYGRNPETNPNRGSAEADSKIAEAITYLQSVHNTNEWKAFKPVVQP